MSSRDKLVEQLLKLKPPVDNATQSLIDDAMRVHSDSSIQLLKKQALQAHEARSTVQQFINSQILSEYNNLGRYAAEAIARSAYSNVQSIAQTLAKSSILSSYVRDIHKIVIPTMIPQFAEALRRSTMIPDTQNQAIRALMESSDSMKKVGMERLFETVSSQTKNIPYELLGGIAESAVLAAFKQIKPQLPGILEEINRTFAGTVAEALKHALEARDEESFKRVEALINEKIDSLPQNDVASKGAWQVVVTILTLLLAFGSFSADIYQVVNTHESNATQPAQIQKLTDLLSKIARSYLKNKL